jgi:hypothetical protein
VMRTLLPCRLTGTGRGVSAVMGADYEGIVAGIAGTAVG